MIPVNEPVIAINSKKYILDCLNTSWVSSAGKYITKFEEEFASYIGCKYALTTTSGTTSLHLALAAIGIGPGDEVILPDLTIISCAFAIIYLGATPKMVDVNPTTGNIDTNKIEENITNRTKAIMVVHLYGQPSEMNKILKIAKKRKLFVIEDAAEAHGAEIKIKGDWKKIGSLGDISCFSFYGNKIVTTGEGGMLLTNNSNIYKKAKLLKDLAHSPKRRFYHKELGYNYRMTNLQAALGLAQLEQIEKYVAKKIDMAKKYTTGLSNIKWLELPSTEPDSKNVYWMYALKIKRGAPILRNKLLQKLKDYGVDTREFFIPLHLQPILKKLKVTTQEKFPVSTDLSHRGFYIPSGLAITDLQISSVIKTFKKIFK